MTRDKAPDAAAWTSHSDWEREARKYLPRKRSPRRRDLRFAVVLFAVAAAFQVQRFTLSGELTADEMLVFQALAVFPGLVGAGFLAAHLLVKNGNGSE